MNYNSPQVGGGELQKSIHTLSGISHSSKLVPWDSICDKNNMIHLRFILHFE